MASYDAVSAIYWAKNRLNFLRGIVPRALRRRIFRFFFERAIARLPSRSFMSAAILPALVAAGAKKMLFVGTQSYNRAFFRACETAGIAVWSIDLEPGAARFGSPRGHFVDDVRLVDRTIRHHVFDVFIFNGIIGFGIGTVADADAVVSAFARIAAPGALLVLGWNPGLRDIAAAAIRGRLTSVSLGAIPSVIEFPAVGAVQPQPHCYEIFRLTTNTVNSL